MNDSVFYVLYHVYTVDEENKIEEVKLLGVYTDKQLLEAGVERYSHLCGFDRYSMSCFITRELYIDVESPTEDGFITWIQVL